MDSNEPNALPNIEVVDPVGRTKDSKNLARVQISSLFQEYIENNGPTLMSERDSIEVIKKLNESHQHNEKGMLKLNIRNITYVQNSFYTFREASLQLHKHKDKVQFENLINFCLFILQKYFKKLNKNNPTAESAINPNSAAKKLCKVSTNTNVINTLNIMNLIQFYHFIRQTYSKNLKKDNLILEPCFVTCENDLPAEPEENGIMVSVNTLSPFIFTVHCCNRIKARRLETIRTYLLHLCCHILKHGTGSTPMVRIF